MKRLALIACLLAFGVYFTWNGCNLRTDQETGVNFTANQQGIQGIIFIYLGLRFSRELRGVRIGKRREDAG